MAPVLIVVARDRVDLYDHLAEQTAVQETAQVILDRRRAARRQRIQVHDPERRRHDRRQDDLRSHGFIVIRQRPRTVKPAADADKVAVPRCGRGREFLSPYEDDRSRGRKAFRRFFDVPCEICAARKTSAVIEKEQKLVAVCKECANVLDPVHEVRDRILPVYRHLKAGIITFGEWARLTLVEVECLDNMRRKELNQGEP